ncbi:MAG: galactokinase [Kiritimatiellaeota bacterium]|nr:galactokinase [Kiritimatiellota bacterium]
MNLHDQLLEKFAAQYGGAPDVIAYAPGRIEVLGNHTDYNEGFVLSAAIQHGTFFAIRKSAGDMCRVTAGDLMKEDVFAPANPGRTAVNTWANYVRGVLHGINGAAGPAPSCFDALFLGDIPLGSGLSSSAALEMSAGLAIARLFGHVFQPVELAKIGQAAEHHFAGCKCGLLDQLSSLHGRAGHLLKTDFRTLEVDNTVKVGDACFLMCDTHAKHALVDGEYNRRRQACEDAAAYFAGALPHPVTALRDVGVAEFDARKAGLDPVTAKRASHPVNENARVLEAADALARGDLATLGRLMFLSHESSRADFENSCPELDAVVDAAKNIPGVLGARLSGGGFGGSAVVLTKPENAGAASAALASKYAETFGKPCEIRAIRPSDGARVCHDAR